MRYKTIQRPLKAFSVRLMFTLSCLGILLSGCASTLSGASSSYASSFIYPTAITHPAPPKVDEITTEASTRAHILQAQMILQGMSLEQKLGQLILVEYLGNSYQDSGLQYMIAQQYVGGFLYQESNHNFDGPYSVEANVKAFSQQTMHDAHIPLLIATDQEGGLVNRLYRFHGALPSAQDMAASGDPQTAMTQGKQAAQWMSDLGINADLAPVVDVHTVDPPILATRMFGRDPQTVATYAGAFLNGLQNNNVIGCLKHFPGLGAISSDPHAGLPIVNRSRAQLESIDLAPYKLMIQHYHPAMIMSTDVLVPAIDPTLPAELSPQTINLLRTELGYDGVVITDGLYMGGISAQWSISEASVLSLIAGDDIVEGPFTVAQVASVVTALKQAIQQGRLSMDRVNQSVQRILLMKMQYGIL